MKTYKTVTRKLNSGTTPFDVKVKIKYRWDTSERLESCFNKVTDNLDQKYQKIANGNAKFLIILVECNFADVFGSDCLGTVWIDESYTIEDCVKENKMVLRATKDLLRKLSGNYNALKDVRA